MIVLYLQEILTSCSLPEIPDLTRNLRSSAPSPKRESESDALPLRPRLNLPLELLA